MINSILENIQIHLSMLDLALSCSQRIAHFALKKDIDKLNGEVENRERLVSVIEKIQASIEEKISLLEASEVTADDIGVFKSWFQDLALWSERMIDLDKETVEALTQQKESTTREIAHLFKNKEMFKGYNHNTKK